MRQVHRHLRFSAVETIDICLHVSEIDSRSKHVASKLMNTPIFSSYPRLAFGIVGCASSLLHIFYTITFPEITIYKYSGSIFQNLFLFGSRNFLEIHQLILVCNL